MLPVRRVLDCKERQAMNEYPGIEQVWVQDPLPWCMTCGTGDCADHEEDSCFECSLHGKDCLEPANETAAALFAYEHAIQAFHEGWR